MLKRQLDHAERVARGGAVRPSRVEKVVKARNKVERFVSSPGEVIHYVIAVK
jgi:hypothetical protein